MTVMTITDNNDSGHAESKHLDDFPIEAEYRSGRDKKDDTEDNKEMTI